MNNKIILAHILVRTVEDFYDMEPEEVVSYIEGEPYISEIPVDPGLTNAAIQGEKSLQHLDLPEPEGRLSEAYPSDRR